MIRNGKIPGLWVAVLSGIMLAGPGRAAGGPRIGLETPRPYGYTVGDTIRHAVTIEPEPGYRLDEDALPKPGPLSRWLELRRIAVEPEAGTKRRIVLEYQTFYAPLAVKPLKIPGLALRFAGPAGPRGAETPAWPFSMSPIHGPAVLAEGGLDPLRPDAIPEAPATGLPLMRCGGFALAGLAALLYLGQARGLWGLGQRGRYFREAGLALRRLNTDGDAPAALRTGFALVHRAFDQTLSEPLFAEQLPGFFASHAGYAGLREEIEAFFLASYALFFGGGAAPGFGLARLEALCGACVRVERSRPS